MMEMGVLGVIPDYRETLMMRSKTNKNEVKKAKTISLFGFYFPIFNKWKKL